MSKILVDLFCGAGGAGMGYRLAGFDVIGVDIEPHEDYPFTFIEMDALRFLQTAKLDRVSVIHASPPCQAYSALKSLSDNEHPDLVAPVRELLRATGTAYVIENVPGSPLVDPVTLCGSEFDLWATCRDGEKRQLRRHRLFESNVPLERNGGCRHEGQAIGVYGTGGGGQMTRGYKAHRDEAKEAMGIDWMKHHDVVQAIPPAYTEHIGKQLMQVLS